MIIARNIFKTTEMHWQERQGTTVRFENKQIDNDKSSQAEGDGYA